MSALWLIPMFFGYLFTAGFTGTYIHNTKCNRKRCDRGDDFPKCIFGAIFFPLAIAVLVISMVVSLGISAESLRPARRREKRDALIREHHKEIYGKEEP